MAMRWLETNIAAHQGSDNFILVLGTDDPQNIDEVLLQKLNFRSVFVSFL